MGQTSSSEFCNSTTGIDQLKAYVTCQESGKIDSCIGLATELGRRPPSEADQKRYLELIERHQVPITTALARKLHQLWRDKRKLKEPHHRMIELNQAIDRLQAAHYPEDGSEMRKARAQGAALARAIAIRNANQRSSDAVYEPALRFANAGIYDIANLDFDSLPEDYKQKNLLYAREVLSKYTHRSIGSDEKNLGYLIFDQTTSPAKEAFLETLKSAGAEPVHEAIRTQAETLVTEHVMEDLVNRHIGQRLGEGLRTMWKSIPMLGKVPSWLRTRLISVAFIGLNEFFYPRMTSCMSSAHPSMHVELNRWTEGCHDVYQADQNVINFLQKSKEEQLAELKDPRACQFYEKFHEATLGQPQFTRLTCHEDRGYELVTESKDGDVLEHRVHYWPGTRDIRQIAIRPQRLNPNKKELRPKTAMIIHLTQTGDVVNMASSELVQAAVMPLRLYIMDAHGCCNAQDQNYKASCLNSYNRNLTETTTASDPSTTQ